MIQRKQSLYLLLSLAIMVALFFINIASICGPDGIFEMRFYGLKNVSPGTTDTEGVIIWPLAMMCIVPTLLLLIAIFSFKKRPLQMKITGIAAALQIGLAVFLNVSQITIASDLNYDWVFSAYTLLPILGAVLSILAYRGISDDEALVKSLDRLR